MGPRAGPSGSNHASGGGPAGPGPKKGLNRRPPGPLGEDDDGVARTARHVAINGTPTVKTYSSTRPPTGPRGRFAPPSRPHAGPSYPRGGSSQYSSQSHIPSQAGPSNYSHQRNFVPLVRQGSSSNSVPLRKGGPKRGPVDNGWKSGGGVGGPSRQGGGNVSNGTTDPNRVDRWTPSEPAPRPHPRSDFGSSPVPQPAGTRNEQKRTQHGTLPPRPAVSTLPPTSIQTTEGQSKPMKKNKQSQSSNAPFVPAPPIPKPFSARPTYTRFSTSPPRRAERMTEEEAFNNAPHRPAYTSSGNRPDPDRPAHASSSARTTGAPAPAPAHTILPPKSIPHKVPIVSEEPPEVQFVKSKPGSDRGKYQQHAHAPAPAPAPASATEKMKFVPKNPNRHKRLASPPIPAVAEDVKPDLDRLYGIDPSAPAINEADRKEGVLGLA